MGTILASSRNSLPLVIILAACFFTLGGCERNPAPPAQLDERLSEAALQQAVIPPVSGNTYLFGFDLRSNPQEDARQYLPFLEYLARATGYQFKLRFTPKNSSIAADLGSGRVDFAAVGAVSYLEAARKSSTNILARGVNAKGNSTYRSYIVVRPNSPLRNLNQLRGRTLAFGSASSTQGHLIPRILLGQHGLTLDDLASYSYTGSHQNCADAVVANKADACGMQDTLAQSLADQGLVRILYRSDPYPSSGIAASPSVPAEAREKVQKALLDFQPQGRDIGKLYNWDRTEMPRGFVAADASDYHDLEKWLLKFDLLKTK